MMMHNNKNSCIHLSGLYSTRQNQLSTIYSDVLAIKMKNKMHFYEQVSATEWSSGSLVWRF